MLFCISYIKIYAETQIPFIAQGRYLQNHNHNAGPLAGGSRKLLDNQISLIKKQNRNVVYLYRNKTGKRKQNK